MKQEHKRWCPTKLPVAYNYCPDCGACMSEITIMGADKARYFEMPVAPGTLITVCKDIWANPGKYWDFEDPTDGEETYYMFLKFLWVRLPNGKEKRLCDIIDEN